LNGFALKYIWKRALSKRVPESILKRKKAGFPVPYESWLRNNYKDQIRAILTDQKTMERGYFRKATIEKFISANSDFGRYSKEIFSLVALELWHRMFLEGEQVTLN
jgi:asparagine synthase (glutamine-hydrolysing)